LCSTETSARAQRSANILHSSDAARLPGHGGSRGIERNVGSPLFTPGQDHVAVQPATRANAVGGSRSSRAIFIDIALEQRGVNRALREAYGIGLCSVEKLGWLTGSPGSTKDQTSTYNVAKPEPLK